MQEQTNEEPKRYQCRHIFTDGRRCGSPCLRGEAFCYYHHTTRRPIENPRQRRARQSHFDLPLPEDRSAIQSAIGQVLQRIAANEIDPKRAGLLLYGLQIASLNLPRETAPTHKSSREAEAAPVEEIVADPTYGPLAPAAELAEPERTSIVRILLENLREARANETEELQSRNGVESATPQCRSRRTGCPTSRFWDVGRSATNLQPNSRSSPRNPGLYRGQHTKAQASSMPKHGRSAISTERWTTNPPFASMLNRFGKTKGWRWSRG